MMEKTMQINGMMCNHCKMTVEKALKAVSGVENVEVDLAAKCAKITLNADVADDVLMDAVAKKGFTPVKWDKSSAIRAGWHFSYQDFFRAAHFPARLIVCW